MRGETGDDVSVLIDAHVHFHECFAPAAFLESARWNFELVARRHGWKAPVGVLMMTESEGVDWFGRLSRQAAGGGDGPQVPLGAWTVEPTADAGALAAVSGNRRLLIVAGRQVVVREGLEVLMLGTTATPADGRPLAEVLAEGARLGALRMIPWGAGKWLFHRGRLLREVMANQRSLDGFFLGDGAGRPFFWPTPSHFREAARRGIRVLGGTDPLPFPSQGGRAGSFGFRLEGAVDLSRPLESIKAALLDPASRLTPFGRPERAVPFVRDQLAMQRRNRRAPRAGSRTESSAR